MSMNPLHFQQQGATVMEVASGSICVLNNRMHSPGMYVVAGQQAQELECYELFLGPLAEAEKDFLALPLALSGYDEVHIDLRKAVFASTADIRLQEERLSHTMLEQLLRALVQRQVARYSDFKYQPQSFVAGESAVPVSGKKTRR
jgi:CDP-6-deoxy-D-xylo-4-hexulose-3-dehydrase